MLGPCIVCGAPATNRHHRKLRSQGGGEEHENLILLCGSGTTGCHGLVHERPEHAYEAGLLVHSWEVPADVPCRPDVFRLELELDEVREFHTATQKAILQYGHRHEVEPGKDCPTCHRRVPHPKKASSPVTKVVGVRVPVDDTETFKEQLDAAAEYLGCKSKPHWRYWALQMALVALLQNEEFKGALS